MMKFLFVYLQVQINGFINIKNEKMKKIIYTIILTAAFQFTQAQVQVQVTSIAYNRQDLPSLDGGILTIPASGDQLAIPIVAIIQNNGTQRISAGDSIVIKTVFNAGADYVIVGVLTESLEIGGTIHAPINIPFSRSEIITGERANSLCSEVVRVVYSGISTPMSGAPYCVTFTINTASNIAGIDLKEVNIYPNPVSDYLKIENLGESTDISIYRTTGQLVLTVSPAMGSTEIDMSNLSAGIYFVKMQNGNNSLTKKIQVIR